VRIFNFPQYSDEWWDIRELKMTASKAQAIGNCGAGLKTYIRKITREIYSSAPRKNFTNKHTERGHELEDSAGLVYSVEQKVTVKKVGFVTKGSYIGCSPDLFVNEDGLCEIKCLDDDGHYALLLGDKPEKKYLWQCQAQMMICDKKFCDLTFYNPNFEKYLLIFRQTPDPEMVASLQKGFMLGKQMIQDIEMKMVKK